MVISVSLLALICSCLRHLSRHDIEEYKHSIINTRNNIQSIYDNQSKQDYELKKLFSIETSSSASTLTSVTSRNLRTNSSEYDNLIQLISSMRIINTNNPI
ncbi:hypothetical protein I4U23_014151 [Adineta vaga]|nr:hypothetical protein I4U23_014151 [Adineta vaga]